MWHLELFNSIATSALHKRSLSLCRFITGLVFLLVMDENTKFQSRFLASDYTVSLVVGQLT